MMPAASAPGAAPKRCAIYTRKSVAAGLEKDFNSLDAQRESCESFVRSQPGWTLLPEHYDDGGFTGANTDRPAFQRLLADIAAKKVDIVVVYKIDRLSRSLLDFTNLLDRFDKANVAFVSVTQSFSTADPIGKLTLNILMSFAEFEREMIAARTRDKVQAARKRGKWTGGPVPLGYQVVDGKLVIDEDEAIVVREVFALYLQHRSYLRMIDELTARGRSTKRQVSPDKAVRGARLWTKDALLRILKNPIYVGKTRVGKETYTGEHPPLIEPRTWEEVQRLMKGKPAKKLRHAGAAYLLRGLVRCRGCGRGMIAVSSRRGRKEYRYYRCETASKQQVKGRCCAPLPAGPLEEFVVNVLREQSVATHFQAQVEQSLTAKLKAAWTQLERERTALPTSIGVLSNDLRKLTDLASQAPDAARRALLDRMNEVNQLLEAQQRRLVVVEEERQTLEMMRERAISLVETMRNFDAVWKHLDSDERETLVAYLVRSVEVDEDSGQAHVDLDVPLADTIDHLGAGSWPEAAQ